MKFTTKKEIFDYVNEMPVDCKKMNFFTMFNKWSKIVTEKQLIEVFNDISWKKFEGQGHCTKYFLAVIRNRDKEGRLKRNDRKKFNVDFKL